MQVVKLDKYIEILSGFAFKSENFNADGKGLPLIRIRDVKPAFSNTYYDGDYDNKFIINNGDLLVGMDGEFNISRWQGGESLINQRVCRIRSKPEFLDEQYLFYFLPNELKKIEIKSNFVTVKHLSVKQISQIEIPLPPLEEQRRIAAILDKADGVRRKRKAAIALTQDLLRSTFLDMFGDPVTNPKGWEIKYLEDFTEIQSGIAKGKKVDESDAISVPYMRVANVQDGYVDLSEVKEIKVRNIDVVKYCLRKGDILLTEGGDPDKLGRGAVWQGQIQPCIHQNHIFCVRPNNQFAESEYLSAIIGSQYGKQYFLRAAKQTTGIATINKSQLRKFPALIPPLSLQKRYVQLLNEIFMTRQRIKAASTEIDNLFNSLLQRAFRGDL